MNLQDVRSEALSLMKKHGLNGWTFKWGNEVGRFALCNCALKEITLSRPMTEHETNRERITNTILHEIAHAIHCNENNGKTNHDDHWQRIAKSIGCNGNRCTSADTVDMKKFVKWVAQCGNCGKEFYKYTKPKGATSCSTCDAKYNPKYELDFKFNPEGAGKY
jgi:predicted SprT family Zn-dependent metalloprotease